MAHYAFLDANNVVVKVITGVDENVVQVEADGTEVGGSTEAWEQFYEKQTWNFGYTCKRTSYNNNFRKQFAGIGYTYIPDADVFVRPKPFSSFILNENYEWQAPVPKPNDGKKYEWFEPNQEWIEVI